MQILEELKGIDYESTKSEAFEEIIKEKLSKIGEVKRQVRVGNRGDGRRGRVDFVVDTGSELIGIEVDFKTPRKKSIYKLNQLKVDRRYVFVRSPFTITEVFKDKLVTYF